MEGFMKCWWTQFLAHFFVCVFVLLTWGVSLGIMGIAPIVPWFLPLIFQCLLVYPFVLWYTRWRGKKENPVLPNDYPCAYLGSYVLLHLFDYYMMYGLMQLQKVLDDAMKGFSGEMSTWLSAYLGDFPFMEVIILHCVQKLAGLTWKVPMLMCVYLFSILMLGVFMEYARIKEVRGEGLGKKS